MPGTLAMAPSTGSMAWPETYAVSGCVMVPSIGRCWARVADVRIVVKYLRELFLSELVFCSGLSVVAEDARESGRHRLRKADGLGTMGTEGGCDHRELGVKGRGKDDE